MKSAGSLSGAARQLHLGQPTISRRLALLDWAGRTDSWITGEVFRHAVTNLAQVLEDVLAFALEQQFAVRGLVKSSLKGPKGNIEFQAVKGQRRAALEGFKIGTHRILVATDIAARGIDVSGIALVINYDLPANSDDYVHRIGRTGRAGQFGKAVSFVEPNQRGDVREIERLIRKSLKVLPLPVLPPRRIPPPKPHFHSEHKRPARLGRAEIERGHEMGYRFKKKRRFHN